ncbi:hypothetical protein [Morganella morganii IS15]|nr:hypothetical protein CSB69_2649 [Morganella morganii]EMP52475.1 hypothetical protein C790_03838 [Morganella morganii SC01]CDK66087.1 hypothetical protein [Morganella morganii IS15]
MFSPIVTTTTIKQQLINDTKVKICDFYHGICHQKVMRLIT